MELSFTEEPCYEASQQNHDNNADGDPNRNVSPMMFVVKYARIADKESHAANNDLNNRHDQFGVANFVSQSELEIELNKV